MPERIVLSRSYVLKALSSCGLKHKVCESQGQHPVLRLQSLANGDQKKHRFLVEKSHKVVCAGGPSSLGIAR